MLKILSSVMMGLVCALGGRFLRSLMIFFWMMLRGCMCNFLLSDVPQMEMLLMRWGYACDINVYADTLAKRDQGAFRLP